MTTGMGQILQKFAENVIRDMVDHPNTVQVNVVLSTKSIILQVKVDKSDCGKIIGRKGRNIDALKVIILAVKNTHFPEDRRQVFVEILEDEQHRG